MPGSILGQAVIRVEDPELLTGKGTYVDNLDLGALHVAFVRSPVAHARITSIDTSAAASAPGVVGVFRAEDLGLSPHYLIGFVDLGPHQARPPLATGKVRFVGEPVVAVLAETNAQAEDGAELVVVDYEPLPTVVDPEAAFADGAPLVNEQVPGNLCVGMGDPLSPDPLEGAELIVRGRFENQRVAAVPMEVNSFAAVPEADGRLTAYAATQMPHFLRDDLARVLGIDPASVRVIAPHVGGGFGAKIGLHGEFTVAAALARRVKRPVKWVETRSEDMLVLPHGRGQIQYVELGLKRDGTITGMRCRIVADAGGWASMGAVIPMGGTKSLSQGTYRIPRIQFDVASALTNTNPTSAYRGAGRPEATAMLERIMDMAAAELGVDPAEFRRRNFLQKSEFPLTTVTGAEYDSGDYDKTLDEALRLSGYDELRAEQRRRRESGDRLQLGIGLSSYVEITAGGMGTEYAAVAVDDDGGATIKAGTSAHGQGHATSYSMIVADRLGIPIDRIRFIQSDTALVPRGVGTGGSRSLQVGGSAVYRSAEVVLDKARQLAAHLLEANPDDIIVTEDGRVGVAGVPARSLGWAELAAAATRRDLPAGLLDQGNGSGNGSGLSAEFDFTQSGATFPFGTHVSVVEVDTETGYVQMLRHIAVDDCGTVLNPLIVAGQQHGGIAQGAAQALYEHFVYDEDGNPRTANLADYMMPSAAELPSFETFNTETPTPLNPLGAKGIGEAGTIGSTPAVQNAVIDAISHFGIRHLDMPCTPERIWQAIESAKRGAPPVAWREPPAVFESLPRADGAPAGASEAAGV